MAMTDRVDAAIEAVRKRFPFQGYMDTQTGACRTVGETVQKYLPPGAAILDFGSGPCDKTAVAQELGYRCAACDDLSDDWHKAEGNKERILAFARGSGIDFRLIVGNELPFAEQEFDMLMMHDVLEHLHDSPRDLLNDLLALVKPEGWFFTTVPNAANIRKRIDLLLGKTNLPAFDGYYWYPGPWRGHVREYVRGDLIKLCQFLSLEIVELGTRHHMVHKLKPALRPIYGAVTRVFPGWRDSWVLVARKKKGWEPRKTLPESELRKIFGPDCPHPLYH